MAKQLNVGDLFPEYEVRVVDGRALHLPRDLTARLLCSPLLPRWVVTLLQSAVGRFPVPY